MLVANRVEEIVHVPRGRRAIDPGVQTFEVGAALDRLARRFGYLEATSGENLQQRTCLASGLALGFAGGELAPGKVALVPVCGGGHVSLQTVAGRLWQHGEHDVSVQIRVVMI